MKLLLATTRHGGAVTDAALGWAVDGDANGVPGGAYNSLDDFADGTGTVHYGHRLFRLAAFP